MQKKLTGYVSRRIPKRWEEAMLLGNGTIGAIVSGDPYKERVILTHEKIYAPLNKKLLPPDTASHLSEIRKLLTDGQYQAAVDFVVALSKTEGYTNDGMRWTDPFFPLCDLFVIPEAEGEVSDYGLSVDYQTGLSYVSFDKGGTLFTRKAFVSRTGNAFLLKLSSDLSTSYQIGIEHYEEAEPDENWTRAYLNLLAESEIAAEGNSVCFRQRYKKNDSGYDVCLSVVSTNGTVSAENGVLAIKKARETVIVCTIKSGIADTFGEALKAMTAEHSDKFSDFDEVFRKHTALHGAIYNRVELTAADPETDTDSLYDKAHAGDPSAAFFKQLFDAGRYEVLSSSGEFAPNLQGVWSGTYGTPWSGDYTMNGNTQTVVYGMLPGAMPECMESLFRLMDFFMPDMKVNAERLYGARGFFLPSRGSTHGLINHFGPTWCMTFWYAGAGWFCHFYYEYWLYTGDDRFFIEKALPVMKDAALFYEDFLTEGEDGKYFFAPSYSPENCPGNTGSQGAVNATMDIAVARELLRNLIKACSTLHIEKDNVEKWKAMLKKMPDYLINGDGALKEWATEKLEDRYDHRHASHLYPLYYGIADEFKNDPKLLEACKKAYDIKIANKKEEAGIMAFGSVQLCQAAIHLGDSETVAMLLRAMAQYNYYPNFASSHDQGPKIFNADISGGVPGLLMESLAYSTEVTNEANEIVSYEITLLPVAPLVIPEGSIRGLRLRGGFILNMSWKDGKVTEKEIINPLGNRYVFLNEA